MNSSNVAFIPGEARHHPHQPNSRESAITLLYWGEAGPSELNALKIAEFMGCSTRMSQLTQETIARAGCFEELVPAGGCVMTSAQTLSEVCRRGGSEWVDRLVARAAQVFVYGFAPGRQHGLVVRSLTSGSYLDVDGLRPGDGKFKVEAGARGICRQFAGLELGAADAETDGCFVEGPTQGHSTPLIRVGQNPYFVCAQAGRCRVMLVACRDIADLDQTVARETAVLQFFSSLVPLMLFVAAAFGKGVWQNDAPTACFMVDDPLLRRRYGFLDYQKLFEAMERRRFSTSIAFIPWNFARSDRAMAELFATHPRRYSLCVHGCDHTSGEFGATNLAWLRGKAGEALEKMKAHRELTGLGFDEVMVFPQGVFSTVAMEALQSCGYLAAVNSTPFPVDRSEGLTLREHLEVAVTRYSNFPLFTRRPPESLAELAFDLFLGKPALLVEHHGCFRNGYAALEEAVEGVQRSEERLRWTNLETACSQACLKKVAADGEVHVRFFTDRFRLRNQSDEPQRYLLMRRGLPGNGSRALTVNGFRTDTGRAGDWVTVRLSLNPGETAEVRFAPGHLAPIAGAEGRNRLYRARVWVRRMLSEFRDNHLDRNQFVSKSARWLCASRNKDSR